MIIFCLSSENTYLSLDIFYQANLCNYFQIVKFLRLSRFFQQLQITNCFCCFLICSFGSSFKCIWCRLFSKIKMFLAVFNTYVLSYIFTMLWRRNSIAFYKNCTFRLNCIDYHFLYFTLQLMSKVMLILFPISSGLEFWLVNHTSMNENLNYSFLKYKIFRRNI